MMIAATLPAIATAASAVPTAASCSSSSSAAVFEQFGDSAAYSLLSGGSFESGAPGWSLTGAEVVAGNETYNLTRGSHSLAIQPTGVALSPSFCVSIANPSFRFVLERTSGSWGALNVILRWHEASGTSHDTTVASLQPGTSWTVSPVLQLATTLPLWQAGSTITAQLVFKPEEYGGAFQIDDVYIDPYRR
jgi:hypothetical protein